MRSDSRWSVEKVKREKIFILSIFLGLILVAFVLITLGNMFYQQAKDLGGFMAVSVDPVVLKAIGISLSMALVATFIAFIFGVPLAYFLARKNFWGKSIIEGIVDIPLMIPHIVAGIALYGVFMRYGVIGAPLRTLGIVVTDAYPGIVVAMLFMCLPYLVDTAREGFKEVDPRLENVARSLGASQWRTFREITFPLAFPAILSGAILSWGRAISEFSAVLILAYYPISAPILIYEKFTSFGLRASRPIAVLLILICLVIFIALRVLHQHRRRK
jgi:molybdate/tungstate transport system permease protein